MGVEGVNFLAGKWQQVREMVFGPSQETMAYAEQQLLNLVRLGVEKAGVQSGGTHRIPVQSDIPLLGNDVIADTINIEVGDGGQMNVGEIERVVINEGAETWVALGSLRGRVRLAAINKKIEELTEHQS